MASGGKKKKLNTHHTSICTYTHNLHAHKHTRLRCPVVFTHSLHTLVGGGSSTGTSGWRWLPYTPSPSPPAAASCGDRIPHPTGKENVTSMPSYNTDSEDGWASWHLCPGPALCQRLRSHMWTKAPRPLTPTRNSSCSQILGLCTLHGHTGRHEVLHVPGDGVARLLHSL